MTERLVRCEHGFLPPLCPECHADLTPAEKSAAQRELDGHSAGMGKVTSRASRGLPPREECRKTPARKPGVMVCQRCGRKLFALDGVMYCASHGVNDDRSDQRAERVCGQCEIIVRQAGTEPYRCKAPARYTVDGVQVCGRHRGFTWARTRRGGSGDGSR